MENGRQQPGTACADGMADGHRAAIDVDPGGIQLQDPVDGHGGAAEGFVYLENIDIRKGYPFFFNTLGMAKMGAMRT